MRNRWISATLWGAAVVLAVGAGTAAVAASSGGNGRTVLSQGDVKRALAAQSSAAPSPSTTPDVSKKPGADTHLLRVTGGTMIVNCAANTAMLFRWTPDTGYRADDPVTGPAAAVSIRFESDTHSDIKVTVTCAAGTPVVKTAVDGDDHGKAGGASATPNPSAKPSPSDHDGDDNDGGDDHGGNGNGGGGNDDGAGHH
jgi:hypothetical protein